jgi:ABC-type sugar transport systems, permease components
MEQIQSVDSKTATSKGTWLKWLLASLVVLLNGYAIIMMYAGGEVAFALLDLVLVASGVYIFLNKRTYAHRYIFPGVAGMVAFIIFPLAYTISIAFTNYSGANLLSLENAMNYHLKKTYRLEGGEYDFTLVDNGDKRFQLVLAQGDLSFISNPIQLWTNEDLKQSKAPKVRSEVKLVPLTETPSGTEAPVKEIVGHKMHLGLMSLVLPDGSQLTMTGLRKFAAEKQLFSHLKGFNLKSGVPLSDDYMLRNNETGEIMMPNRDTGYYQYVDAEGHFVGGAQAPGFIVNVGWKNFMRVMTDPGIQGPFLQIFVWTVIFAACSVGFTLVAGMVLACLAQWEELQGRGFYRMMLILPYAVPAFISILVFKGLFNQNFGEINMFLGLLGFDKPEWYTSPALARTMILIVNTWLGYPYMMILCMGMLKSIPEDLYEASAMDGAGPLQNFFKITVPLLMKPLTPLLIASFAFNFNNFVLIQLLTNGSPDILGATTPAGTTDLLVSYTYRIAFQGAGGQDYGLAGAIATVIFLIVGALALLNLKLSKVEKI